MITSRKQLKEFLKSDFLRYPKQETPLFIRYLVKDEQTRVKLFIWILRHTEYSINTNSFTRFFWLLAFKRYSNILRVYVNLNTCGKGLRLVHIGGGIYLNAKKIGENFTATTGVVLGKKGSNDARPIIGDDVYFTLGSKAYGKIRLGNNIIVAPNTVVIRDVPSNSVISGVPGKIIKSLNE